MSAEAEGWVWKHSPYKGATFQVHLAVADVVNDLHGWEFWAANAPLAAKARVGRQACNQALRRMVADGLLEVLWSPPAGKPAPVKYRFLMPAAPVVWPGFAEFHRVAVDDSPKALTVSPETTRRVAVDDSSVSPETTQTQEVTQAVTQGAPADNERQSASPSSRGSRPPRAKTRTNAAGLPPCPSPTPQSPPAPAETEARRIADQCAAHGKPVTQVRLMVPVFRALLEKGEDPVRLERVAMGLRTITEGTMGVALDRLDQREQLAAPVLKARPGPPPPPVVGFEERRVPTPEERAYVAELIASARGAS